MYVYEFPDLASERNVLAAHAVPLRMFDTHGVRNDRSQEVDETDTDGNIVAFLMLAGDARMPPRAEVIAFHVVPVMEIHAAVDSPGEFLDGIAVHAHKFTGLKPHFLFPFVGFVAPFEHPFRHANMRDVILD